MSKNFLLIALAMIFASLLSAQTTEEIKSQIAEKEASIAAKAAEIKALEGEVGGLKKKLVVYPEWKYGALGTIGANFSRFNDWLGTGNSNAQSSVFGFSANGFANLQEEKYFWRNALNLNVARTKLVVDHTASQADTIGFETTADAINLTSLFGYKLNPKWAISSLAEYRSTIASNFNNPGYLDIGVGATWTPVENMVVVFHPLNYNIVFADDDVSYDSSLGCKIVADYTQSLPRGIAWRSNLSAFVSYSEPSDFSNWTWVNGFNFTAFKGIGVGFEFGLRKNKQEGYNTYLTDNGLTAETFTIGDLDTDDNPLQTYWLLGLTYSISK